MATILVTNPGNLNDIRPNLQTAINSAAATGDTIILPQGSFLYTGTITTTKRFTLKGAVPAIVNWNGFASNYNIETTALTYDLIPTTVLSRD